MIRIREVRLFHKFEENMVQMEVTWKELNLLARETTDSPHLRLLKDRITSNHKLQRDVNALSQLLPTTKQEFYEYNLNSKYS